MAVDDAASVKSVAAVTVNEMVAVCVLPPPVPLTVTEYVPTGVAAPALSVRVELPEPGAAIVVGLKAYVAPDGSPVAVSATAALKPPVPVELIVAVVEPPWAAVAVDDAASVKSGAVAVIVNKRVVICDVPPPVPVIAMVYVPGGVDKPAVRVNVELPEPGAAMKAVLKDAVAPTGKPFVANVTAELKPPSTVVPIALVPESPCGTVIAVGGASVKSATAGKPIFILETVTLPRPIESFPCMVVKPLMVVNPSA